MWAELGHVGLQGARRAPSGNPPSAVGHVLTTTRRPRRVHAGHPAHAGQLGGLRVVPGLAPAARRADAGCADRGGWGPRWFRVLRGRGEPSAPGWGFGAGTGGTGSVSCCGCRRGGCSDSCALGRGGPRGFRVLHGRGGCPRAVGWAAAAAASSAATVDAAMAAALARLQGGHLVDHPGAHSNPRGAAGHPPGTRRADVGPSTTPDSLSAAGPALATPGSRRAPADHHWHAAIHPLGSAHRDPKRPADHPGHGPTTRAPVDQPSTCRPPLAGHPPTAFQAPLITRRAHTRGGVGGALAGGEGGAG